MIRMFQLFETQYVANVAVVGVQMDHSCRRLLKIFFDFSVFLLLLNASILKVT